MTPKQHLYATSSHWRKAKSSCTTGGATVQGMPHVGHVRSAIVFDVLVRWLEYRGFAVTTVRNVTTLTTRSWRSRRIPLPRTLKADAHYRPREEWYALAYRFEQEFARAYEALGVRRPTYEPRATGHITEMHELISQLIERGHAYPAADDSGDVYFDVRSYEQYGALTRQKIDDMQDAPDSDPRGKKDPVTSRCGRATRTSIRSPLPGQSHGAEAVQAGTLSARRWPASTWAANSTSMVADWTCASRTTRTRWPSPTQPATASPISGCTTAWSPTRVKRCPSPIGNTISPEEMLALADARVVRYFLGQASTVRCSTTVRIR
ncbi:hypothetical protein [Glutamicibacter arilaitensis]